MMLERCPSRQGSREHGETETPSFLRDRASALALFPAPLQEQGAEAEDGKEGGAWFGNGTDYDRITAVFNRPCMDGASGLVVVLESDPHPAEAFACACLQREADVARHTGGKLGEMRIWRTGSPEAGGDRAAGIHRGADSQIAQGIGIAGAAANGLPAWARSGFVRVVGYFLTTEKEVCVAPGQALQGGGNVAGLQIDRDTLKGIGNGDVLTWEPGDGTRGRGSRSQQENGCIALFNESRVLLG